MDLLFHRYASPFVLLDQVISTGDFSEFVSTVWQVNEEEMQWQYYLFRVFDKSFTDFKEGMKPQKGMTKADIETTVKDSKSMLDSFIPEQKEGVKDLNGII